MTSDIKLRQTNMFIAVNLDFLFKSNFSSINYNSKTILLNGNVLAFYIRIEYLLFNSNI